MSDKPMDREKAAWHEMYEKWESEKESHALTRSTGYVIGECCQELERQLTLGAYLGWQDRQWWLFRKDGEGIESGKTIEELLFKLYT